MTPCLIFDDVMQSAFEPFLPPGSCSNRYALSLWNHYGLTGGEGLEPVAGPSDEKSWKWARLHCPRGRLS